MLSLLLDDGLDDNMMVDGTVFHTLDALERSADSKVDRRQHEAFVQQK